MKKNNVKKLLIILGTIYIIAAFSFFKLNFFYDFQALEKIDRFMLVSLTLFLSKLTYDAL